MTTINIIGIDNNGNWIGRTEKPATLVYTLNDKLKDLNGVSINMDEAKVLVEMLNAYILSENAEE